MLKRSYFLYKDEPHSLIQGSFPISSVYRLYRRERGGTIYGPEGGL